MLFQAVVEVLALVGLQLLEGDPRLTDELVVAELVLVAHRNPDRRTQANAADDSVM